MHTGCVQLNQHPVHNNPIHKGTAPYTIMLPQRKPKPLRVFSSIAYSLIVPKTARRDNSKYPGKAGWLIGYSDYSEDFVIFNNLTRTIRGRRDVLFDEHW